MSANPAQMSPGMRYGAASSMLNPRGTRSMNMALVLQRPAAPDERHARENRQNDGPQLSVPERVVGEQLRPALVVHVVAESELERDGEEHQRDAGSNELWNGLTRERMEQKTRRDENDRDAEQRAERLGDAVVDRA